MNNENGIHEEKKEILFQLENDEQTNKSLNHENHLKCRICEEICVSPKFLFCTHSFCFQCIHKLSETNRGICQIECPSCQQTTQINDLKELIDDLLLINEIEEYCLEKGTIECRSCSSSDRAIAHCSTCSSYLCCQCCQAHQYMKCFEQHHVRYLNEQNNSKLNQSDEQVQKHFQEKFNEIDQQRLNALTHLDQQLTKLENHSTETKKAIQSVYQQYEQILKDIFNQFLFSLTEYQREEEMKLIDQLENVQKASQCFDDIQRICQRYLNKTTAKQFLLYKDKLFDHKFDQLQNLFLNAIIHCDFIRFETNSIENFEKIIKLNFGELIRRNLKEKSSTIDEWGDTESLLPLTISSSSRIETNSSTQNNQSPLITIKDEYFHNSSNENQPVVQNLRALQSIFVNQLSIDHQNVQRNLQEILQMNQQDQQYSILTRQTSAPPLGQRSSSSNINSFPPPSLLTTYSSTNSGGSSNANNSRSTTPFLTTNLNCPIDINLNVANQSTIRRNGQSMQVRAKFGSLGPQKCQFNAPHGFCLGIDEEIIVADTNNHRIQIFDKIGEFKYQFGIPGKEEGQLWYPRKVAVIRQTAKFVVCDRGNERSRMQIFTRNGHFIKKISIRYIDIVAGLAITQQANIVAVDSVSPTVFCISESGDLLKWFDCSDYMREPSDIAIFNNQYFVCDFKGHCVVVFDEEGIFLRRIGEESVTNFPNGIDISDAGDIIIGDSHGNRFHIAVYNRQGDFLQEFDCPYVKVSRCCGLKITSDGFIVTLAKNNHHVLVLNTLYLT